MNGSDPKQWAHEPPVLTRENWYRERLQLLSDVIAFRAMKRIKLSVWLVEEYNELVGILKENKEEGPYAKDF